MLRVAVWWNVRDRETFTVMEFLHKHGYVFSLIDVVSTLEWRPGRLQRRNFHIHAVRLDIIKVLFIHQLMTSELS